MQKLIVPAVILAIILGSCGLLTFFVNRTMDTSSHTLDSMALLRSMDVMNNQVNAIDKLTNLVTLQNVGLIIIVLVGAVVLWQLLRQIRASGNGGGHWIPAWPSSQQQVEPGGYPTYVSLNYGRAREYIRRLNDDQAQHMLNALYPIVSLLEQRLGIYTALPDRQESRLAAPKKGFLVRHAEVSAGGVLVRKEPDIPEIKWGE